MWVQIISKLCFKNNHNRNANSANDQLTNISTHRQVKLHATSNWLSNQDTHVVQQVSSIFTTKRITAPIISDNTRHSPNINFEKPIKFLDHGEVSYEKNKEIPIKGVKLNESVHVISSFLDIVLSLRSIYIPLFKKIGQSISKTWFFLQLSLDIGWWGN